MNKQEKIQAQTWKYFWEQKIKEITKFIGVICGTIFLPFFIGKFLEYTLGNAMACSLFIEHNMGMCEIGYFDMWGGGVLFLLILTCFILIILLIHGWVRDWLKSNWKKARKRARKKYENE